ncbi:MAG TPA: NUDIX hydrolase [Myxococcota bacterium]|nr:NUDIX hydrolase [Myxococcota bacterium]
MTTRVVHRGRSFTVQVEDAVLPNGRTVALDMVRHPGAAAVVPFEDPRTVLLIRQFRHAAAGFIWEVPAGKLDGDTPEVCAHKELAEEAGRRAGKLVPLSSIFTTPGFTDEVIHLFAAFELTPVPQALEHDEVIEVVATPLARALEMIWSGELRDAKSALALLLAARHVGALK